MLARILLYSRDASLLSTRSSVLNRTGLPILNANTLDEVESIAAAQPIAMLALCHTVSAAERQKAIAAVHLHHPEALAVNVESLGSRSTKAKRPNSPRATRLQPGFIALHPPAGTF
jgi:hypothetical protein